MMADLRLPLLMAGALALAAVVYAELASGPPSTAAAGAARSSQAESAAAKAAAPGERAADLDEVLALPLFTPGRQPAPGRHASAGQAGPFEARLVGILYSPEQREVLFAGSGRSNVTALHEGESFEGWTVEHITPERVIFSAGGRSATVELADEEARGSRPQRTPGMPGARGIPPPGRVPGVRTNAP